MRKIFERKFPINYIYFGLYFLGLAVCHLYHIHLIDSITSSLVLFFSAYSLAQLFLEASALALLDSIIRERGYGFSHIFFVMGTSLLFLLHFIDCILVRLMGMTVWHALNCVVKSSLGSFLELLKATHITPTIWIFSLGVVVALICLSLLFYLFSSRFMRYFSPKFLVGSMAFVPLVLMAGFFLSPSTKSPLLCHHYQRALPWKQGEDFAGKEIVQMPLDITSPKSEQEVNLLLQKISEQGTSHAPDIYLFIVESLREDYLTQEAAPSLCRFREASLYPKVGVSAANSTHLSWFSLFFSKWALHYSESQLKEWKMGSPALRLLKDLGYQIEVFSASRLNYYGMDRAIFGENLELVDQFHLFPPDSGRTPSKGDLQSVSKLIERATGGEAGQRCFIVFMESTHFDYSWPEYSSPFSPYLEKVNHLSLAFSKGNLEALKNRYRNAIHWVDHLFGSFCSSLKDCDLFDDAIIGFTGDHGEEFFEEGNLFHASSLSDPQVRVPLYLKLGSRASSRPLLASHVDIFPTIFHDLLETKNCGELFQGESLLEKREWPYILVSRFEFSLRPTECFIHDGTKKVFVSDLPSSMESATAQAELLAPFWNFATQH